MWRITFFSIFILSSFLISLWVEAKVVINEVAWMGNSGSYQDEWIELYNDAEVAVVLTGWILKAADGRPEIQLEGTVPAKGFWLLERTDDTSVPDVEADQIYKGALSNSGEILELRDNFGNLVDIVSCQQGWYAGDNETKQTMERKNPTSPGDRADNWQNSLEAGGTPGQPNSKNNQDPGYNDQTSSQYLADQPPADNNQTPDEISGGQLPEEITESEIDSAIKPLPSVIASKPQAGKTTSTTSLAMNSDLFKKDPKSLLKTNSQNLLITEFIPSPAGPDKENEWIEIYNEAEVSVELNGWQIKDESGKTFTFGDNQILETGEYLSLSRPQTKIAINNDGETLYLINPQGQTVFQISYGGKAPEGASFARDQEGKWRWTSTPTPGKENKFTKPKPQNSERKTTTPSPKINNLATLIPAETTINLQEKQPENPPGKENKIGGINVLGIAVAVGILFAFISAILIRKIGF